MKVVVHVSDCSYHITSFDRPYTRMHLVRCSGGEEDELEFEFPPPPGQFKFTGKCSSPLSVSRTLNKSIWGEFPFTLDEEV